MPRTSAGMSWAPFWLPSPAMLGFQRELLLTEGSAAPEGYQQWHRQLLQAHRLQGHVIALREALVPLPGSSSSPTSQRLRCLWYPRWTCTAHASVFTPWWTLPL
eukprot:RCo008104